MVKKVLYVGHQQKEGYLKDTFFLEDKDGNQVSYDIQSSRHSEDGRFFGYLVAPMNIDPLDYGNEANYQKIKNSAYRYFAEHPEKKPKGKGPLVQSDVALVTTYLNEMVLEAAREREERGEATVLERALLHQKEYIMENQQYFSFEQLTGEVDLLDAQAAHENLMLDPENERTKREYEQFMESADRGVESMKNRMKQDAAKASRVKIDIERTSAPQNKSSSQYLTEDEKNAVVRDFIDNRSR